MGEILEISATNEDTHGAEESRPQQGTETSSAKTQYGSFEDYRKDRSEKRSRYKVFIYASLILLIISFLSPWYIVWVEDQFTFLGRTHHETTTIVYFETGQLIEIDSSFIGEMENHALNAYRRYYPVYRHRR